MKISAVCTDIDGTLLDARRELSDRTISVIKEVAKKMPVILASSRMPSAMRHLQQELGIERHPMICYNGGYVLHLGDGVDQVLCSVGMKPETASRIYALAEGTEIHVSLYREDEWTAPRNDYWTEREERITKTRSVIGNIADVLGRYTADRHDVHKVMCMGPEQQITVMERQLLGEFSSEIHVYRSRPTYLELAPRAISKATGLEVTLERYGIPLGEVIAFGDNYNDIEMLRAVGKGIAVANSKEEVMAVAAEITLRSVDDGVAVSLEKHIFHRGF